MDVRKGPADRQVRQPVVLSGHLANLFTCNDRHYCAAPRVVAARVPQTLKKKTQVLVVAPNPYNNLNPQAQVESLDTERIGVYTDRAFRNIFTESGTIMHDEPLLVIICVFLSS